MATTTDRVVARETAVAVGCGPFAGEDTEREKAVGRRACLLIDAAELEVEGVSRGISSRARALAGEFPFEFMTESLALRFTKLGGFCAVQADPSRTLWVVGIWETIDRK